MGWGCVRAERAWVRVTRQRRHPPEPPTHPVTHPRPPRRRSVHGGHDSVKDNPFELELSWVTEANKWRYAAVAAERVAAAEAWAKAQIEAEEMGEDDEGDD